MNWRSLLLPVCALLGYWALLIYQLGAQWSVYSQYNYGWAVPFLCAYLIWQRLHQPGSRGQQTEDGRGAAAGRGRLLPSVIGLLALALAYAPTRLLHEANPIWRLTSWLWTLEVIAITLLVLLLMPEVRSQKSVQPAAFRPLPSAFVFPLLFFLVAVPWPSGAENFLVQTLTRSNVAVTIELLNLFGIPALQHGNLIEVTTGVVGVDEACSGIRSFQATLMLSLFFGELYSLTVRRRIWLCLLGFASSFGFNVARTFILTYVAAKQGVPALDKWHDPAGITILVWCFVVIWFASLVMKAPEEELRTRRKGQGAEDRESGASHEPGSVAVSAASSSGVPPRGAREGAASVQPGGEAAGAAQRTPASAFSPQPSVGGHSVSQQLTTFNPQPSTLRTLAIGLAAWLVLVEVGVEWWYRSHETQARAAGTWSVVVPPADERYREVKLTDFVLSWLSPDEHASIGWRSETGHPWQLFYFRWLPARGLSERVEIALSRTHRPDHCLPASGRTLIREAEPQFVQVKGLSLPFRTYLFDDGGMPLFVFHCLWEEATPISDVSNLRENTAARIKAALEGKRGVGQRSLQVAVWGYSDVGVAKQALGAELEPLLRVGE